MGQDILPRIPIGAGRGHGIAVVIAKGEEKVILRSTTTMYDFIQLLDNGNIYFTRTDVLSINHWGDLRKNA
jgi:hypothetical protein